MSVTVELAERVKLLPPYLFKEIDEQKAAIRKQGVDIIDLGVGDPDMPTPPHIIDALDLAANDPANHRYPSYSGMVGFNEAVARWYGRRFGVDLDPNREVITLIGSKEGIAHIPLAYINPGDLALATSPGYPVYHTGVQFAGGSTYFLDLKKENGFLPDLDAIPADVRRKAKLVFVNYPNNPTSTVAEADFYERLVRFAETNNILVCHDAAYSEIAFDGYTPRSFLQTPGAKEVGIEFHSLSKTYNMTGWRLGFAVGRADVIQALGKIKSNIDSGAFQAVQYAGIVALDGDQRCLSEINAEYQKRRDILVAGLRRLGFSFEAPKATFYVWVEVPKGYTSKQFAGLLLQKAGIVVTPGNGFGEAGEGYFRIAMTVPSDRIAEALDRIDRAKVW
ncbi:LL-diaminopimelate aminotransferase [Desulfatirhabdium butyrativorans]|uniref:LL-diaminopimelate aminotransferase n=1 Tax=Desulfatirhabdium butyrativorans TaxID=340467 RepID=UPI000410861C|nr:LL-diaminopimelate aminotransferase [Desulfatirhabdium butyrativorans]